MCTDSGWRTCSAQGQWCDSSKMFLVVFHCDIMNSDLLTPQFVAITKTCLLKYIENFTKNGKFSDKKNYDIFYISAQNVDCGY